jgi:hypothetical protein
MADADGYDGLRLINEAPPCAEAVIEDIQMGSDVAVGEPIVTHKLPNVPDRIQLGGSEWKHCDDVGLQRYDNSSISLWNAGPFGPLFA